MILYKKAVTRSLSLLGAQFWEQGEREEMRNICDGVFFFSPFLWSRPGKGVAAFYNWTDPQQDPTRLAEYFSHHAENFHDLKNAYLRRCEHINELIQQGDPRNFAELFQETTAIWPVLTIVNLLGKWDSSLLDPHFIEECQRIRSGTDRIYYQSQDALLQLARNITGSEDVAYLLFSEISSGKLPKEEEVRERKRGWVYFQGKLATPTDVQEFAAHHDIDLVESVAPTVAPDTMNGQIACRGRVRGRAKLVFERSQIHKVQPGDILVAPMTTPDFMEGIVQAAALVTDEGGITCHAAIVARELSKPCIIGTKIATSVLRDGDHIEVDADHGIVRILHP